MSISSNNEQDMISYTLERKQVKNINLRIRADGSVIVSASKEISKQRIDTFVHSKATFIRNAQAQFECIQNNAPTPKQYISGESFRILGRDVRLKLKTGMPEGIINDGVFLILTVKDPSDFEKKQRLVKKYLAKRALDEFTVQTAQAHQKFGKYGVAMPTLRMREMKTRWGSCLPSKGIITLNTRLLEMPRPCIEYVVLHEFCHFIHPNHSRAFYDFLAMFMPDWKERKTQLEAGGRWET